ncbi:MAG: carotenoid 1,2-hydratase, partial [Zoogloea sp.]|nr:carotenoid 1,2-hydratase [Zoogloea sp.]
MRRRRLLLALSALPAWRMAEAAGGDFAPVRPGRRLVFPADHGAHPDFRTEWWYATGWLSLPDGSPLGFQATFFRVRTGVGEGSGSAFAPR